MHQRFIGKVEKFAVPQMRSICLLLLLAITSIISPCTAFAQTPPVGDDLQGDLRYHAVNLETAADPDMRRRAARYLLRMQAPEAIAVIEKTLRGGTHEQVTAVLDALEIELVAPPALIDPLVRLLGSSAPQARDEIAVILVRYRESGIAVVTSIALNTEEPLEVRLGAIRALRSVQSTDLARVSVDALMTLISRGESDHASVADAAFEVLTTITRITRFGKDASQWTAWWAETRDQPASEWLPEELELLTERVAEAQQQLEEYRQELDTHRARLDELMGEVYFLLLQERSDDELQAKLATWINDPLATVRRIALRRIDTRIANRDVIGDGVKQAVLARLADPKVDLRRSAALLLDRLQHPQTGAAVAAALSSESDPKVRLALLDVLSRRPDSAAVPLALALIEQNETRTTAARVLDACAAAGMVSDEQRPVVSNAARNAFAASVTPETVKLLAAMGDEQDVRALLDLLPGADAAMRSVIAMSTHKHAGVYAELAARTGDAAVFPALLAHAAGQPRELDRLKMLLTLVPPDEATRETWATAVAACCAAIPLTSLREADDVLSNVPGAPHLPPTAVDNWRDTLLSRAIVGAPDVISQAHRVTLLTRLARVRLRMNHPARALEALDAISRQNTAGNGGQSGVQGGNGAGLPDQTAKAELDQLRFETLLRLARFDDAAVIHKQAQPWIEVRDRLKVSSPEEAAEIEKEIIRRFPGSGGGT
ncbi:MAG: HEAT repeat domain-containing protein [Phycisphaerales bacterium]